MSTPEKLALEAKGIPTPFYNADAAMIKTVFYELLSLGLYSLLSEAAKASMSTDPFFTPANP
jgi:hypothetical protein